MFSLTLAEWGIRFRTNSEILHQRLYECLSSDVMPEGVPSCPPNKGQISLTINLDDEESLERFQREHQTTSYDLASIGYARSICYQTSEIHVNLRFPFFIGSGHLLHHGFLFPLSYLFREHHVTLIHAGLVADSEGGILIVGTSGSGKSSLSLALAKGGYRFFSDEHPLLSWAGDRIIGFPFFGLPALTARTVNQLQACSIKTHWLENRAKFGLDLTEVQSAARGEKCSIKSVIFPSYDPTKRIQLQRIKPLDAFYRLCKDDYLALTSNSYLPEERKRHRFHTELLLSLVSSSENYSMHFNEDGLRDLFEGAALGIS